MYSDNKYYYKHNYFNSLINVDNIYKSNIADWGLHMNSIPKNFLLIFVVLSTITACNRNTSIETQTQPNPPTRDCSVTPPCTIQDLKITKTLNVGTATITDATFNNDGNIIANSSAYNFVLIENLVNLNKHYLLVYIALTANI